jgi:hypothetical protein
MLSCVVGVHCYAGDILKSKKALGWRTMLVVPELESELALAAAHQVLLPFSSMVHQLTELSSMVHQLTELSQLLDRRCMRQLARQHDNAVAPLSCINSPAEGKSRGYWRR